MRPRTARSRSGLSCSHVNPNDRSQFGGASPMHLMSQMPPPELLDDPSLGLVPPNKTLMKSMLIDLAAKNRNDTRPSGTPQPNTKTENDGPTMPCVHLVSESKAWRPHQRISSSTGCTQMNRGDMRFLDQQHAWRTWKNVHTTRPALCLSIDRKEYAAKRMSESHAEVQAIRCLKRYIARGV